MRNKKLISRILVILLSILMMLTSIPLNLFTAFAEGGGGAGGGLENGNGTSVSVDDDPLNDENIGLRIYLVTKKDGQTTVVKNRYSRSDCDKYYLDIWMNGRIPNYNNVNSTSRYSPIASTSTIVKTSAANFDVAINGTYATAGVAAGIDFRSHLQEGMSNSGDDYWFTEVGGFNVAGEHFYNWFMSTRDVKGEPQSVYELVLNYLYAGQLKGINPENTFLVVEPIVFLCNPDSNWATTGNRYVASWYGYITYNTDTAKRDPGRAHTVRNRLQKLGSGFRLANTDTSAGMESKIKEVLGLEIPSSGIYDCSGRETEWFGYRPAGYGGTEHRNIHKSQGLGLQVYWLKGTIKGLPIDTYNIVSNPQPKDTPSNAETPSEENQTTGDKTIIKMYVDLYKDPNTNYYTQIVDKVQYAQKNVSDKVTITNEEPINGYKVSVWYSSGAEYKNLPKGSSMIATTDIGITDGTVKLSSLGGKQLIVNNYTSAKDYAAVSGGKSYYAGLSSPHGTNGKGSKASYTSKDAKPYTTYKRLAVSGTSNYGKYNYKVKDDDKATYVELGENEKTLVILYTREMSYISTTDTSVKKDKDARKDNSGELTIVKLYGVINPSTYEIEDITSKTLTGTTRNVNIHNEPGYNFAEWIYVTSGKQTIKNASVMGDPSYCSLDGTVDQAYRLDGFVDGFKNNASLRSGFKFNGNFPVLYTITGSNGLTSAVTPGRYSYGSRSGIGTKSYNSTIYFGGTGNLADSNVDGSDKNDVLYLLFLKADQLSYSTDDLVIPESYITRYDNYKHNPMKVTGSVSGNTYTELLQAHKFKYVLPVIKDVEYKDLNPLFIPHIKSQ